MPDLAHSPIYLTGSQRSGSSWVAKILSTVEGVAWLDEPFNHKKKSWDWGVCAADFSNWYTYIGSHNEERYKQVVQDTLSYNFNLAAAIRYFHSWREARQIGWSYRHFAKYQKQQKRPLIKQPTGLFMAEWLAKEFDAQIVILIRHPGGYVNSRKRLGWKHNFHDFLAQPELMRDYLAPYEKELRDFAENEYDLIEQLSFLWKILFGTAARLLEKHPEWLLVRYDDLAFNPEQGFKQLFEQLGLDFSPTVEKTIKQHSKPSNPAAVPLRDWKLLKRNSQAAATLWQKQLTADEIGRIYERVQPVSAQFYGEETWPR